MKIGTSDRTLESFHLFPYAAWGITILFALFVYSLIMDLQTTIIELELRTEQLEQRTVTPAEQLEDFE